MKLRADVEYAIKKVIEKLSIKYSSTPEVLLSSSRKREYVQSRQICITIVYLNNGACLDTIGKYFGGRDHSTCIYAMKTVKDLRYIDKVFNALYEECNALYLKELKIQRASRIEDIIDIELDSIVSRINRIDDPLVKIEAAQKLIDIGTIIISRDVE